MDIAEQRFRTPDGLTLIGDVGGNPDTAGVILLHGGGQTRHSWAGAMRRLMEAGYRVVNYDARGHGESDWSPTGDYSLAALASDLRCVRETMRGRVALVGASMGGMTSFYAAGGFGEAFADALVMVDIVLHPAKAGAEKIFRFMTAHPRGFASVEDAADAVAAYNPHRARPSDSTGLLKNLRLRDDGRLHWHWDPRFIQAHPTAEPPSFTEDLASVAHAVTLPTLLIWGAQSDVVDEEGVAAMRALVPQTEVFAVPQAGHMVAGDRNDAFNEGVIAFLKQHIPASRG